MSVELTMLIWAAALTVIQMLIATSGAAMQVGAIKLAGNREDVPAGIGWVGRAQRAHRNMLENLVLFAILAIAVQLLNKSSPMTVLGAQLFFWGRVAYALVYIAGLPWLRTLVWLVSMVGLVMMFIKLVGA